MDTIESLWVDLLGSNADVIDNAAVETVDRTGVNQGPLAKVFMNVSVSGAGVSECGRERGREGGRKGEEGGRGRKRERPGL